MPETDAARPPRTERPPGARGRRVRVRRPLPAGLDTLGPAFVLTLLFHLLLFKGVESSTFFATVPATKQPAGPRPVQVLPANTPVPANLLPPSMRPTPPKFVQVNPLAPSLKPDKTTNTGAADQRAAQRDPDPLSKSETPRTKGDTPDSTRITQGVPRDFLPEHLKPAPGQALGKPAPPAPAPQPPAPQAKPAPKADRGAPEARPQGPSGKPVEDKGVPFVEKPGPAKPEARGKADKIPEKVSPEKSEPDRNAKPAPSVSVDSGQSGEPAPKNRPKATLAGTAGPLGISLASAPDKGSLDAQNSVFSRMGEYAQRMLEVIQAAWWEGADRSRVSERGTVVVEFTLHKDGSVTDARIVSKTTSDRAAYLCLDAVTGRAPFDAWPDDMIGIFGEKQEGRLTFHYR